MKIYYDHEDGLQISLSGIPYDEVIQSVHETPEIFAYAIFDELTLSGINPITAKATAISYSQQTQAAYGRKPNTPHLFIDGLSVIH